MTKKIGFILVAVTLFGAFLIWLFIESSKPLPGTKIDDLGRGHVPIGENVEYNSNPPTSGKHNEEWIKSGVYPEVKDDRYLIHSLEHGYVIMSYNCDKQLTIDNGQWTKKKFSINTYAHGIEEEEVSSSEATSSASLPESFKSEDCHKLVDQLISVYEKKGKTRLIVVPRPNLDVRLALTAWNYLDKFNGFDEQRVIRFIDAHLNQGPEKTMEK